MPISKSAKKAFRSSERKRAHNLIWEQKLKKSLKKVDKNNAREVISLIDKTAKNHLISKNKAARLKSRLAKKFGPFKSAQKEASKIQKHPVVKKKSSGSKSKNSKHEARNSKQIRNPKS